jgi:hypothetical protein
MICIPCKHVSFRFSIVVKHDKSVVEIRIAESVIHTNGKITVAKAQYSTNEL